MRSAPPLLLLLLVCLPEPLAAATCEEGTAAWLVSPFSVVPGDTARVLAAKEEPVTDAVLTVTDQDGNAVPAATLSAGRGPPWWITASFVPQGTGTYTLTLSSGGRSVSCLQMTVTRKRHRRDSSRSIWPATAAWNRKTENLYSAWLENLFWVEEGKSWKSLHEVTRSPERNLLHNHLGHGEDDAGGPAALTLAPDCADNPFMLRAYFSWKLGLPYGHHRCTRGSRNHPPQCSGFVSSLDPRGKQSEPQAARSFLRRVASDIHSSSARTALDSDETDLYPVPLTRQALRPGTVFADPYGHTLTLVRFIDQTSDCPGQLLAVDAQPDGTVAVKRFWRGNFLFTTEGIIGGPGFKHFRPVTVRKGTAVPLTNAQVTAAADYADFSLEQQQLSSTAFHDSMERVINPMPLDPAAAYKDLHAALHEQLQVRVGSVENGEEYMRANGFPVIPMPAGLGVFLSGGPWEDFSTPNRDFRLLVAMDALADFPARMQRQPEAFAMPPGKSPDALASELAALHETWCKEMTITYRRSDGSTWSLTLADVLARAEALEMAYNPNDCPEVRWGAAERSDERTTCARRAPKEQLKEMERLRTWFHERRRPAW
jgi:hypothetical protein